jgi:hypothetical protein
MFMNDLGNDHGIDKTKAIRMIRDILKLEQENLKTKKYNDYDMIDKIRTVIEEEVRKCY